MLKIKDKTGKLRFILNDEDDQPISIDEVIIQASKDKKVKEPKDSPQPKPESKKGE